MDAELEARVDTVLRAYRYEIEHWKAMPKDVAWSRERLGVFVHHEQWNATLACIIDAEIAILYRRLNRLRSHRLGAVLH